MCFGPLAKNIDLWWKSQSTETRVSRDRGKGLLSLNFYFLYYLFFPHRLKYSRRKKSLLTLIDTVHIYGFLGMLRVLKNRGWVWCMSSISSTEQSIMAVLSLRHL